MAGIVPVFGQLFPRKVPFLVAYRPYAGNWRFSWHVVSKKAAHKLEKLKTIDTPLFSKVHEETLAELNPEYAKQSEFAILGTFIHHVHDA